MSFSSKFLQYSGIWKRKQPVNGIHSFQKWDQLRTYHFREQPKRLQIFQNVWCFRCYQHHVEFLHWLVHVSHWIGLNECMLFARCNEFGECGQQTLNACLRHLNELPGNDDCKLWKTWFWCAFLMKVLLTNGIPFPTLVNTAAAMRTWNEWIIVHFLLNRLVQPDNFVIQTILLCSFAKWK